MGSAGTIAAGIIVGLIASAVQSLGLTIQRKSHVLNEGLPEEQQRLEYRRPLWLLGFAIFISSNIIGSIFQIASLPVVILAPLGAVSLLWNAFFARILLGDGTSPWVIAGTLLIAGGAVLIGIFGVVPEPTRSLEDLLRLFHRPAFIIYFTLLGFVIVVVLAITHITEFSYFRHLRRMRASGPLSPVLAPSAAPSSNSERTPLLDRKRAGSTASLLSNTSTVVLTSRPSRVPLAIALSYASVSGIVSGMCLIFAKSGVELLLLTVKGDNQFWRWQAWMLLLGLVAFALLQLWYLHKALKLANPTIVCPLAFCFYNLSSIVNGLVYYDQFALLSTRNLLLVILGTIILIAGVWAVSLQSIDAGPYSAEPDSETSSTLDAAVDDDETSALEPLDFAANADIETGHGAGPSQSLAHRRRTTTGLSVSTLTHDDEEGSLLSSPPQTHGRPHTHLSRRRHTLSPELSSPPPAAPGFTIGLSPVSPGFSLGRRRASGQHAPGRSHARVRSGSYNAAGTGGPEGIRRAVSEGATVGLGLDTGEQAQAPARDEHEVVQEPREQVAMLPVLPVPVSNRRGDPWRWLKGLTGRTG